MIILKGIFISTLSNDVIIFYDFYKRINISCHHKWNGCNKNVLPYRDAHEYIPGLEII